MPPLNTPEGQAFIDAIIERIGGVDLVIFDNVMSLIVGDILAKIAIEEPLRSQPAG